MAFFRGLKRFDIVDHGSHTNETVGKAFTRKVSQKVIHLLLKCTVCVRAPA